MMLYYYVCQGENMEKILRKADAFAAKWHNGQFRKDGITPYIEHPRKVFHVLNHEWNFAINEDIKDFRPIPKLYLIVALLHDVLEDTDVTEEEIKKEFGQKVLDCVKILTYYPDVKKEDYMKNIADNEDVWLCVVKYVDRLCNTFDFIISGKVNYAKKYLHKADLIWERLVKDKDILGEIWFEHIANEKKRLEFLMEN